MDSPTMPDNRTSSTTRRLTRDGRIITYQLTILQQPDKARACGSGAKSSADRRPVDPPPIVELRMFEGENATNDITFSVDANYFLFVTLEPHRSASQGRIGGDNRDPVLTGTPVSGLVYLDRPNPAGYFLFPDLSVRHEGKYVLNFSLYEELKQPKDRDMPATPADGSGDTGPHVTQRLSVQSKDFTVYSAKKFPGLNQSTELSRTVAEQGCRVRIRRDARVRKRGADDDQEMKDDEYERDPSGNYATPGIHHQRTRVDSMNQPQAIAPVPPAHTEQASYHKYDHRISPPMAGPYERPHVPFAVPPHAAPGSHGQPYGGYAAHHATQQAYMSHSDQPIRHYGYQESSAAGGAHNGYSGEVVLSAPPGSGPAYLYQPLHEPHQGLFPECRPGDQVNAVSYPRAPSDYSPPIRRPVNESFSLPSLMQPPNNSYTLHTVAECQAHAEEYQQTARLTHPMRENQWSQSAMGPTLDHRSYSAVPLPLSNKRAFGQVFDTSDVRGQMRAGPRPCPDLRSYARHSPEPHTEDTASAALEFSYKRADGREMMRAVQFNHQ